MYFDRRRCCHLNVARRRCCHLNVARRRRRRRRRCLLKCGS